MIQTVTLNHEDWDFNKVFSNLASRGVKEVRVAIPPEWRENREIELAHIKNLMTSAQLFGVTIAELAGEAAVNASSTAAVVLPSTTAVVAPPTAGLPKSASRRTVLLIVLSVLILAILISGGIYLSKTALGSPGQTGLESPQPNIRPTSAPAPAAAPAPTPALSRAGVTIRVLNGSGIRGAAAKLQKQLEDLGYRGTDVANAPPAGATTLRLSPAFEAYRNMIMADLENSYVLASGSALPEGGTASAEIIIGKN